MTDTTTAKQYARWCMMLIEGQEYIEDYIWDDIFTAMFKDGFTDEEGEWLYGNNEND